MPRIENHTFDELAIGDKHTYARTLTPEDFERFSRAAGELDPAAVESGLVTTNGFEAIAGVAGWAGALAASVIAGQFPGLGSQLVRYVARRPAPCGAGRRGDARGFGAGEGRGPARHARPARRQPARRSDSRRQRRSRRAGGEDRAWPGARPQRRNP